MINILETAARAGGAVLTRYFRSTYTTSHKDTPQNIVTQADIESQKIIHETILKMAKKRGLATSEIGFIGEEKLNQPGRYRFIIDPLDGTTNFSVGLEYFSVPIAFLDGVEAVAAVVYQPLHDVLYIAQKGKGAYKIVGKKREKLIVKNKPLDKSVLVAHLSSKPQLRQKQLNLIIKFQEITLGVRYLGCVSLDHCYFADGVFGVVVNSRTFVWDTAATQLIIEEAGGTIVDWSGYRLTYDLENPMKQYNSIVCHPKNLAPILTYFKD